MSAEIPDLSVINHATPESFSVRLWATDCIFDEHTLHDETPSAVASIQRLEQRRRKRLSLRYQFRAR
jgi:hypothetical protein